MAYQAPQQGGRTVVYAERIGNVKYTYYDDGIVKITRYKPRKKIYWGRIFVAIIMLCLLILGFVQLGKSLKKAVKGSRNKIEVNNSMPEFVMSGSDETPKQAVSTPDEDTDDQSEQAASYSNMNIRVCIDPGHGDYDTGTVAGDGIIEAEQNLEISLLIRDYLESCGVVVTMTRESDVSVSLSDRCSIANEDGCDFFISMHRNSISDTSVDFNGVEAWVNNKAPYYDTTLAQNILYALDNVGVTADLGVKYGYRDMPGNNYQVNMDTVMPSCLVELGYVTSEQDNELFLNNKKEYAEAIGNAVIETAIQLGVISDTGERLLSGQLISDGKNNVYVTEAYTKGGSLPAAGDTVIAGTIDNNSSDR